MIYQVRFGLGQVKQIQPAATESGPQSPSAGRGCVSLRTLSI